VINLVDAPSKWPRVRLGELCDIQGGFPAPQEDAAFENGEIPFVRMKDVGRYHFTNNLCETGQALNRRYFTSGRYELTPRDSILMPRSGSVALNHRAILKVDAVIVSHLCALIPNSRSVTVNYLYRFLCLADMRKLTKKTTGLDSIAFSDLRMIAVPLPPLDEQRRISAILDKAEELRAMRYAVLAQLGTVIESVFLDRFGNPTTNPKGIRVARLSDVTTRITDGVHQKPEYTESGVSFISVKDITTGILSFEDCKFISRADHEKFTKRCKPERGDILYTKVGATYGKPALVDTDRDFSIYVSVCLIKPRKEVIDPIFLCVALGTKAIKSQADNRIKGIGVPDLHLDQIQSFLIPLPSLKEQQNFSGQVAAVQRVRAAHRASLAEMEALFASLQHRAFRGEL
jgi:type I restriction enzyme, S subunit